MGTMHRKDSQMAIDRQETTRPINAKRDQDGQQMVEFAFTFTIFVVLLLAVVGFSWVFFSQATLVHAAQQGTRHLLAHPLLPDDPTTFDTADEEATWVITTSAPLLDWHEMTINILPPPEERISGSYVAVEIYYDVPLPTIEIPVGFTDDVITVLRPLRLHAMSKRSLN